MSTNILFTSVTGYIGGSVLLRFLARPDVSSLKITALIRSPEKAAKFATFGVNPVVGSHTDHALLENLASEADVVISIADSDYVPAIRALLRGLEKRHKATGRVPIFIQTSGTGVLADNAKGEHATETVYDDADAAQIESLALSQPHRPVDVELDAADEKGYVRTYIILPSTIYGIVNNKFTAVGIQNPRSIQLPALVNASLARGQGGTVGAGKNLWNNVAIDDIADLYLVLYDSIQKDPHGTGHGREGYYFGENGTHSLYEVGKVIAETLYAAGKGQSPEPTPFTKEEIKQLGEFFAYSALGSNSRAIANRSRSIGWKPRYTTKEMLSSIRAEVEESLKGHKQ
ncbi:hypothetical protein H0H92_004623 [Tricholoma furcatifolium]|nr:hypothetical protein H0H92_004623 [Tricholoma furcatifolium]